MGPPRINILNIYLSCFVSCISQWLSLTVEVSVGFFIKYYSASVRAISFLNVLFNTNVQ